MVRSFRLNQINEVFDYFNNKHKKHIDGYISVQIAKISTKEEENSLMIFPTIYKDRNRKYINDGFWGMCNNCELKWNEDSLQYIYDEISSLVNDLLKEERFGGSFVGHVKEVIDTNLISIDLTNSRVIKGMKLIGHRVWVYSKGEETLKQYILDKEDIINYYNNNPDELEKLRNNDNWRPTHWYQSANSIDELLLFFEKEIDSLRTNYDEVIADWKTKVNYAWDSIMKYEIEIIKVSDDEAIGKIIWKKAPYVTPQKGDYIDIDLHQH